MRNVLVHGPAFQAVEVLVQPQVSLRDEGVSASQALVDRGLALNHTPPDAARTHHEIVRPLCPRVRAVDFSRSSTESLSRDFRKPGNWNWQS